MQKCAKHHHTLLQKDADCVSQKKPYEDGKEDTHIVALSINKEVLLMTCKVKVTAADGSSIIVRVLN